MQFEDWGLIDYEQALEKQLQYVNDIVEGRREETLVFCTHPPVVTLGRSTKPGDVFAFDGPVVEINRGGRATYHGPSQLVIYPLLDLSKERNGRASREIAGYLRALENSIVEVLKEAGIAAEGRSLRHRDGRAASEPQSSTAASGKSEVATTPKTDAVEAADETGVWVGARKIASLGIGVRRWVSFHGAAINLAYDPKAHQGLNPCGFQSNVMTSVEQLTNAEPDFEKWKARLRRAFEDNL